MEKQPAIEISGLTKSYGDQKALNEVTFTVNKGEILGFLGPNGAGKSTTMNILTGYIAADAGSVKIDGISAEEEPQKAKKMIGYLPEIPPLYTDMTVIEYLRFVYDLKMIKANQNAHLDQVMKCVKILDVKNRLIKNLSKGYKQRVGFAQALIGNPEILILDEPTVGLDPNQIMEMRALIRALGKEHTIILSTHILGEVSAVCDRYIIINNGSLVAEGNIRDLTAGSRTNAYTLRIKGTQEAISAVLSSGALLENAEFLGSFEDGTEDLSIQKEDPHLREALFQLFASAGLPILSMTAKSASLEELFVKTTSKQEVPNE